MVSCLCKGLERDGLRGGIDEDEELDDHAQEMLEEMFAFRIQVLLPVDS